MPRRDLLPPDCLELEQQPLPAFSLESRHWFLLGFKPISFQAGTCMKGLQLADCRSGDFSASINVSQFLILNFFTRTHTHTVGPVSWRNLTSTSQMVWVFAEIKLTSFWTLFSSVHFSRHFLTMHHVPGEVIDLLSESWQQRMGLLLPRLLTCPFPILIFIETFFSESQFGLWEIIKR